MAYIKAISYYLPKGCLGNNELLEDFPEWDAEKVSKKVGIQIRHVSGPSETATDMGEMAAKKMFAEYNIDPQTIDFLIFCTQSPDYFMPSSACILQKRLEITTHCGAFDFDLGCSGCIYGMAIAKSLIAADVAHNILLITSETLTKYLHRSDKSNRSIFGDGAAACLITKEKGLFEIGEFELGTDGSGAENLIVKSGGFRQKEKTNSSSIDSDGHIRRDDYLYMNGSAIFNFTLNIVPNLIDKILNKNSMHLEDIDYYIFHQANKFMLSSLRKICFLPKDKFYINLENTGNTVSSTILIAIKDCLNSDIIKPGMSIMISGFGVGLSWGGTVLKYLKK